MPVPTGYIINGNSVRNDGGVIVTPGGSFGTTRFEEGNEVFGVGPQVSTLPKTGLVTIDTINATAGATSLQPGDVIAKVQSDLAGIANTKLKTMGKSTQLQQFKRDNASGIATATAIRGNQWNQYSGAFSVAPSTFNSAWGTDFSVVPTGGITSSPGSSFRFMTGRKHPSGVKYQGKTCW